MLKELTPQLILRKFAMFLLGVVITSFIFMSYFLQQANGKIDEIKALTTENNMLLDKLEISVSQSVLLKDKLDHLIHSFKLPGKPYKPDLALDDELETRCLALGGYYESRSGTLLDKEKTLWMIVNRTTGVDGRNNSQYRPSTCAVLAAGAGKQYESITGNRLKLIQSIVWEGNVDARPSFKSTVDEEAWYEIYGLASDIVAGKNPRLTTANHFVSLTGLKGRKVPEWVAALKPVGTTNDGHLLMVDYITTKNGKVQLTKSRPYDPIKDPKIDLDAI